MPRKNSLLSNLDWGTVLIYLLLVLMGWLSIYAAVYSEEHSSILDLSQRYGKQLIWIGLAFGMGLLVLLSDNKIYSVFAYVIYGLSIVLLLSTLVFGREVNGARSWLHVGSLGIQPAEFVKFATALALAKLMGQQGFKLNTFWAYVKVGAIIALPAGIILLQNDTGSAMVLVAFVLVLYREGLPGWVLMCGVFMALLFILTLVLDIPAIATGLLLMGLLIYWFSTRRTKDAVRILLSALSIGLLMYVVANIVDVEIDIDYYFTVPLVVCALMALVFSYFSRVRQALFVGGFVLVSMGLALSADFVFNHVLETHHQKRINDLLGIEQDPLGWGYNVNQSKIAIGSGGLLGKGFLNGTQTKFNFVPEQSTDFIFCTVGEEWGFVGVLVVLLLFGLLLLRLIKLAERQREAFARIYGYSVVSIIFFHVAVNIGMTVGLFPVIGIPLPFFSYGGSSLWAFTLLLFIFLRLDTNRFVH
ncbi:MAG: rod shape-determining protein RodA [Bacteroidales bacterium]|nr:rod shape-determining protein RodA [Bacteroidales bacterium]